MPRRTILTVIRVFLAIVFMCYGLVKLFGGQFDYGNWVIDKSTTDGASLVWRFYGYSPWYARFIALAELGPAIMLLIPRFRTLGALALFAVSLNVTVMDFAFDFPSVKYMALFYTILLGVLLWADRHKLLRLVEPDPVDVSRSAQQAARMSPRTRNVLIGAGIVFVLFAANVLMTGLDDGPELPARAALEQRLPEGSEVDLVRSRYGGLFGFNRTASVVFETNTAGVRDTVEVTARKATGFTPWRIDQ